MGTLKFLKDLILCENSLDNVCMSLLLKTVGRLTKSFNFIQYDYSLLKNNPLLFLIIFRRFFELRSNEKVLSKRVNLKFYCIKSVVLMD